MTDPAETLKGLKAMREEIAEIVAAPLRVKVAQAYDRGDRERGNRLARELIAAVQQATAEIDRNIVAIEAMIPRPIIIGMDFAKPGSEYTGVMIGSVPIGTLPPGSLVKRLGDGRLVATHASQPPKIIDLGGIREIDLSGDEAASIGALRFPENG